MSNFCYHCGVAVTDEKANFCTACGKVLPTIFEHINKEAVEDANAKLVSSASEINKQNIEEAKAKLFNFASQVKDVASKVTKDLQSEESKAKVINFASQVKDAASKATQNIKNEVEKINDARKATASEANDLKSESKVDTAKAIIQSFWSKLTGTQKGILIGIPVLLIIVVGAITEDKQKIISDSTSGIRGDSISRSKDLGISAQKYDDMMENRFNKPVAERICRTYERTMSQTVVSHAANYERNRHFGPTEASNAFFGHEKNLDTQRLLHETVRYIYKNPEKGSSYIMSGEFFTKCVKTLVKF